MSKFENSLENKETALWIHPNVRKEIGEIRRALKDFLKLETTDENMLQVAQILDSAPLVDLTEELWEKLENTDSYSILEGDLTRVQSLVDEVNQELSPERKRNLDTIVDGFKTKRPMETPIIIENEEGAIHLVSGNTRLMTARALGIRPKVVMGKYLPV